MKNAFWLAACILFGLMTDGDLRAFSVEEIARLAPSAPGGPFGDNYGQNVLVHGDFVFATAILSQPTGKDAEGAVYVYRRTGDQLINTQIISKDGMSDHFGALNLQVVGDWLFIPCIGTPAGPIQSDTVQNQDFTGSLQIYHLNKETNQWIFVQAIDRTTPGLENLTVIDPAALVSPPSNPPPPSFVEQGATFGLGFSVNGDEKIMLVGAPGQENFSPTNQPLINSGVVFAFKLKDGKWELTQQITNPEGVSENDMFGGKVIISGKYALISNASPLTNPRLNSNNSVFLYQFKGDKKWHFEQVVQGDQTTLAAVNSPFLGGHVLLGDAFGGALAFNGKRVLIGAPFENLDTNAPKGAAYFYELKTKHGKPRLVHKKRVLSDDPGSFFTGVGVAIDGYTAVIGDPGHTGPSGNQAQGALLAYRFHKKDKKWHKKQNLFDREGFPFEFLGGGVDIHNSKIMGGTGNVLTTLILGGAFVVPAYIPAPIPPGPNKAVVWQISEK